MHAIAGNRHHYRPLNSVWLPGSADPRQLALAYKTKYQFDTPLELYLADLDAIIGTAPADLNLYADLATRGLRLWVDAGSRTARDPALLFDAGVAVAILGLETLAGPEALAEAVDRWGADRIVFSLDLRSGRPLGDPESWGSDEPIALAELAWNLGVTKLLLLDLAQVGMAAGPWAEPLLGKLSPTVPPSGALFVGGGVRSRSDLDRLRQAGASAALVGTALHDGRIEPFDLNDWLPESAS